MNFPHGPGDIHVRALVTPDELAACVSLYESTFGLRPRDGSLNTRLLVGIARNGGIVVGASGRDGLVGFAFSFLARDVNGAMYQYSQVACVQRGWQGRGVGRRLKLAQREIAIAAGIAEIRWAFDPFQTKNAHFNLDVLGAHVHELVRNLYGEHGHGLDGPDSTHRLIAVWTLDSARVRRLSSDQPREARTRTWAQPTFIDTLARVDDDTALVSVPASWAGILDAVDFRAREVALSTMERLFTEGFDAVACSRVSDEVAHYIFTRRQSIDA